MSPYHGDRHDYTNDGQPFPGEDTDEMEGMDPVPIKVPRRRFAKPGCMTSYESVVSRNAMGRRHSRRIQNHPPVDGGNNHVSIPTNGGNTSNGDAPPVVKKPAISSLSSVLNEVMNGRQRALSSYMDATAQPTAASRFIVKQDADGTLYVASSSGEKYFGDTAIGKVFLDPAPNPLAESGRRSDMDFVRQHTPQFNKDPHPALQRHRSSLESSFLSNTSSSGKSTLADFSDLRARLEARKNSLDGAARAVVESKYRKPDTDEEFVDAILGHEKSDEEFNAAILGHTRVHPNEESTQNHSLDPPSDPLTAPTHAQNEEQLQNNPTFQTPSPMTPSAPRLTVEELRQHRQQRDIIPFADDDDDDDDDNPLNRSFLNVRDIDFEGRTEQKSITEDPVMEAGRVRVSSSAGNVAEFIGGYKGQLSRRSNTGGLNRARSVRSRKSAQTAAIPVVTELTRRLREARNRIPVEFRDDLTGGSPPQKKKKKKKSVRFDLALYCREFEVESEVEDDQEKRHRGRDSGEEEDDGSMSEDDAPWEYFNLAPPSKALPNLAKMAMQEESWGHKLDDRPVSDGHQLQFEL